MLLRREVDCEDCGYNCHYDDDVCGCIVVVMGCVMIVIVMIIIIMML
jgi:hypothetical protein